LNQFGHAVAMIRAACASVSVPSSHSRTSMRMRRSFGADDHQHAVVLASSARASTTSEDARFAKALDALAVERLDVRTTTWFDVAFVAREFRVEAARRQR